MSDATPELDEHEDVVEPTSPEPEERYGQSVTWSRGQVVLHAERGELHDLVRRLRDDEEFNVCVDVTAVDYLTYTTPR
ncbi:MAG TPA: hypothetical protein VFV42_02910, partial [Acidimicrobiales bacterium]|nr:hypothetical protein [Acidimicrobiales bacterium]